MEMKQSRVLQETWTPGEVPAWVSFTLFPHPSIAPSLCPAVSSLLWSPSPTCLFYSLCFLSSIRDLEMAALNPHPSWFLRSTYPQTDSIFSAGLLWTVGQVVPCTRFLCQGGEWQLKPSEIPSLMYIGQSKAHEQISNGMGMSISIMGPDGLRGSRHIWKEL